MMVAAGISSGLLPADADSLAAGPVPPPEDSLETRWIVPGRLPVAMAGWFARYPATAEARQDTYLLQPQLPGLSVKLRDDSALEVKAYLGSRGILGLPGHHRGRLQSWRKWSFPCWSPGRADAAPAGWVTVRKRRCKSWVPLVGGQAGCTVELTQNDAGDRPWWSVGFEATGPAGLRRQALERAAEVVFTQPPPARLSLDSSRSYAQWLGQWPARAVIRRGRISGTARRGGTG
jgi:hypothetical protein